MSSLAASIKELGVLQPVLVRRIGGESSDEFELIAGERRWRASRRAGLHTIPVLIQTSDDTHSLEQALVENLHRQDLNVLEEAAAYQQLIEEFGFTHDQVATRVGKSRTAVTNILRLLQLPSGVQRLLAEGQISPGHARALLGTPDRGYQEVLARQAVAEGLTVRAIEDLVRDHNDEANGVVARPRRSTGGGPSPVPPADRTRSGRHRCPSVRGTTSQTGGDARPASAAAPGNPRARGAAVEPPQHSGEGRHVGQTGQSGGRIRHPRGPRADLQAHGRWRGELHSCLWYLTLSEVN